MTWKDNTYFAPEALVDGKNRQIVWTWLLDNLPNDFKRFGWTGVFGLPRNVWYEGGELKQAPVSEIDKLQYGHIAYTAADGENVKVGDGTACRIKGEWSGNEKAGVTVRISPEGKEYTEIYYSPEEKKLVMDTTHSGKEGWRVREEAPFELRAGEKLSLDILIDKSVIEVYANKRQAICRRVYPTDPKNSTGVKLIGNVPEKLDTYKMFPSNPY
jgi:beta-fructofuranosidase